MQINGKDRVIVESDVRVFIGTNLTQACHLRAVLQDRQDSAMEGSPLYQVLHDLDRRITEAQDNVNTYVETLASLDQEQRSNDLQRSLHSVTARDSVSV